MAFIINNLRHSLGGGDRESVLLPHGQALTMDASIGFWEMRDDQQFS